MLPIVQITMLLFKKAQATWSHLKVFVDCFLSQQHEVNQRYELFQIVFIGFPK